MKINERGITTMSSKRAAAREWKRKRNQQKMVFRLSVAAVCLVILLGIGYLAFDSFNRSFVMTFEGRRIPTQEAQFFFMGGIMGTPREQATVDLTMFLLLEEAAARHNVGLTTEERQDLLAEVDGTRDFLNMFGVSLSRLSDARVAELMGMDILVERLAEIYAGDIEIDEEEFTSAFFSYSIFNRHEFVDMNLLIHESYTMDDAVLAFAAMQEAASAEEINQIIINNVITRGLITDEEEIATIEAPMLTIQQLGQEPNIDPNIIMELVSLAEGDISMPFEVEGFFYVFVVESVTEPPMDEVEAGFRAAYIQHERISAFEEIVIEWRDAADVRHNQRGIDSL